MRARVDEAALRAIITYKWVKGLVQLLLAGALAVTMALGHGDELAEWAHEFRTHSTRAYAILLGRALERATSPRGLHITLLALIVDGTITCVEGWALQQRHSWGPWLVVGVTGAFLPFEVYELVRHFHWSRLLVLLVNAAVVAFLVAHARAVARGFDDDGARATSPHPAGDGTQHEAPPRA
ncbi:MAG TPA: DUF2127 domain-containing protein [Myxococcaceae bacterium]|nr:DUF2127 domain-containing protein [Myxococcaceae bacterium]